MVAAEPAEPLDVDAVRPPDEELLGIGLGEGGPVSTIELGLRCTLRLPFEGAVIK
jgi:hypothetical protein